MQTPRFLAREGAVDDQPGDAAEIAQLENVGGDFEAPIELLNFPLEIAQTGRGALQAFGRCLLYTSPSPRDS